MKPEKRSKLGYVGPVMILASMAWMAVEMISVAPSHRLSNPGQPSAEILFTPSRSAIAFYFFVFTLTFAPAINIGLILRSIGKSATAESPALSPKASPAYYALAVFTLALSSVVAGYP